MDGDATTSSPQKVDEKEEDDDKASWTSFGSDVEMIPEVGNSAEYDSEEEYCPNYPQQKQRDHALSDKYSQQIQETQGFDIDDYPGSCMMATIYPMPCFLKNPKNYDMLKDYAERALEVYNRRRGTDYAVAKVLKVNGGGCRNFNFYITFSVETRDGTRDWFQAKVVEDIGNNLEFQIVRPKGRKDLAI